MMRLTKRLGGLALALGLLLPGMAQSQAPAFPSRPVRIVVGFPPGGSTDVMGRWLAEALGAVWPVPVLVENRGGAGGNIAAEAVTRAAPDGHTLLMILGSHVTNRALYRQLPYDPVADFKPVSLMAELPFVLLANPAFPGRDIADVLRLAREQPGRLAYATAGIGTAQHLAGELLARTTGIQWNHIPYRGGGPALTDTVAGAVPLALLTTLGVAPLIQEGRIRAVGIASANRSLLLPNVPTFAETGLPGFSAGTWYALVAPLQTPDPIVARLHADVARVLATPQMRERFATLDATIINGGPEQLARLMRDEDAKWAPLIRDAGIRAE
jgi:tripartite-type tricarboxylate transporter receptor subunit TctC